MIYNFFDKRWLYGEYIRSPHIQTPLPCTHKEMLSINGRYEMTSYLLIVDQHNLTGCSANYWQLGRHSIWLSRDEFG